MAQAVRDHAHRRPQREVFRRHRPEETVLYQCVEAHWPAFLERAEEAGGLPKFVVREFEAFLDCGRLEAGCLHLACRSCGHSQLVAFICKKRAFCPSCCGRRMANMAVHLEQNVLPRVPVRHWICSLPWGLRALLGYDRSARRTAKISRSSPVERRQPPRWAASTSCQWWTSACPARGRSSS